MRQYTYYIELIQTHTDIPPLERSTQNPLEAFDYIAQVVVDHVLIDIRKLHANIDYGNLILFLNQDRAFVRLLEHRDFVAHEQKRNPTSQTISTHISNDCTFYDELGETFQVSRSDTISRQMAR